MFTASVACIGLCYQASGLCVLTLLWALAVLCWHLLQHHLAQSSLCVYAQFVSKAQCDHRQSACSAVLSHALLSKQNALMHMTMPVTDVMHLGVYALDCGTQYMNAVCASG